MVHRHVTQMAMAKWENIPKLCIWDGIHTEEKMNYILTLLHNTTFQFFSSIFLLDML